MNPEFQKHTKTGFLAFPWWDEFNGDDIRQLDVQVEYDPACGTFDTLKQKYIQELANGGVTQETLGKES